MRNQGELLFGKNFTISASFLVIYVSKIEFGNDCLLSWDVLLMDMDFHKIKDSNNRILNVSSPISIGEHVWIGCRCLILKGAVIPNNAVIGASVVLTQKLSVENCIYAGSPVRSAKDGIVWEL